MILVTLASSIFATKKRQSAARMKRALAVGSRAFLAGEIERQEAVSKSILQNAFQAFVDHGYLALRDNKLDLGEAFASPGATSEIAEALRGYIPEVRA